MIYRQICLVEDQILSNASDSSSSANSPTNLHIIVIALIAFFLLFTRQATALDDDAIEAACEDNWGHSVIVDGVDIICVKGELPTDPSSSGGGSIDGGAGGAGDTNDGGPGGPEGGDDEAENCPDCDSNYENMTKEINTQTRNCISLYLGHVVATCSGWEGSSPRRCDGSVIDLDEVVLEWGSDNWWWSSPEILKNKCNKTGPQGQKLFCSGPSISKCMRECMTGMPGKTSGSWAISSPGGLLSLSGPSFSIPYNQGARNACYKHADELLIAARKTRNQCEKENDDKSCPATDNTSNRNLNNSLNHLNNAISATTSQISDLPEFNFRNRLVILATHWFERYVEYTQMNEATQSLFRDKLISTSLEYHEQLVLDSGLHSLEDVTADNMTTEDSHGITSNDDSRSETNLIRRGTVVSEGSLAEMTPIRTLGTIETAFFGDSEQFLSQHEYDVLVSQWPTGLVMFGSNAFRE